MNTDIRNLQESLLLKTHDKYKQHILSLVTKSEHKEYLLQATQYEPEEYFLYDTKSQNKYGVLQGGLTGQTDV